VEKVEDIRKQLRGPWRRLRGREREIIRYIEVYTRKLLELHPRWNPEALYYTAKALALYRLMTGEEPEIAPAGPNLIYLKGRGGDMYILRDPISYRGPFTRGYRYVKVDVINRSYKIVKVKVRKVWRRKSKN